MRLQEALLLGLEAGHLDSMALGFDLLLLGNFVVDRLNHLRRRLQVPEEEGRGWVSPEGLLDVPSQGR